MYNVDEIRKDFPLLNKDSKLIYFDNGATSLKPRHVIEEITNYYSSYSANAHRGDYEISFLVDKKFEKARETLAKFINSEVSEVVFTSGTTASMNIIAESFFKQKLQAGDEIILSFSEHASSVLPWFHLAKEIGVKIVYAPLNDIGELTVAEIEEVITKRTKLISLAHISNTIGDERDVEAICKLAHEKNIYTVVDAAQSAPHLKLDVKKINCDFLAFSAHKMCGPTGIGLLYGKQALLEEMVPFFYGGGMNARFDKDLSLTLKKVPTVFEAGTQNIAGVLGFAAAVEYLESIGLELIDQYLKDLKSYAIEKLKDVKNVIVYNAEVEGSIILFNIEGIFAQDLAQHLDASNIAVRAGHHCAKLLVNKLNTGVTCRASFYLYNTYEEIDEFIESLKKGDDFLEAIF